MDISAANQIRKWFTGYTAGFAVSGAALHPMQQLKLDHSLAVAAIANTIARGLAWPEPRVLLAEIAGLLHDTGRFSQYAEFQTFEDRRSVNHAWRGWEVLERERALGFCAPPEAAGLQAAVSLHNCREIPPGLAPDQLELLHLVRDADKLDIIAVFDKAIREDKISQYPEISLHVDLHGPPNPEVVAAIRQRHTVGYSQIRSLADFLLIQLLWMGQLELAPSRRLAREQNLVDGIAALLPDTLEMRELTGLANAWLTADEALATDHGQAPARPG